MAALLKIKLIFSCMCSGRRVFYSITTGRTTEIAEVSRGQPLDDLKIGPKVLTNGKLRQEQLMLLEAARTGRRDSVLRCPTEQTILPSSEVLSRTKEEFTPEPSRVYLAGNITLHWCQKVPGIRSQA